METRHHIDSYRRRLGTALSCTGLLCTMVEKYFADLVYRTPAGDPAVERIHRLWVRHHYDIELLRDGRSFESPVRCSSGQIYGILLQFSDGSASVPGRSGFFCLLQIYGEKIRYSDSGRSDLLCLLRIRFIWSHQASVFPESDDLFSIDSDRSGESERWKKSGAAGTISWIGSVQQLLLFLYAGGIYRLVCMRQSRCML